MTRHSDGGDPPGNSQAILKPKRRFTFQFEQSHTRVRKRKFISSSEMLTLRQEKPFPSNTSNRFEALHSCSRRRRKRRKRNSSGSENSRKWVFSSRDFSNHKEKVVVVSYNILGVENALKHPDLYCQVPPDLLEWDHRKRLICDEISNYNAGILCFQEVDRFGDMDCIFTMDGYQGVYKGRTGESKDGCAIFWKDKLFTLLYHEDIEFQKYGLRNNVAQLCVLQINNNLSKSSTCTQTSGTPTRNKSFVVGNIHVLFNPNRGDIKLGQVRIFLESAYKLSQEWGNIPVIIAGDFNSVPQSPIYQFLASSKLDVQLHDRRRISLRVEFPSESRALSSQIGNTTRSMYHRWNIEELRFATGAEAITRLQHHLKLCSAYIGIQGSGRTRDDFGEPVATSSHSKFMGTVDYIWHTKELVPVRVLETLPLDSLRTGGLPTEKWGSDHIALVCEFAFTNSGSGT